MRILIRRKVAMFMNGVSTKIKIVSSEVRLLKREHYRRKYRYQ